MTTTTKEKTMEHPETLNDGPKRDPQRDLKLARVLAFAAIVTIALCAAMIALAES